MLFPGSDPSISTEELLIQITKIKNALLIEISECKTSAETMRAGQRKEQTQQFKQNLAEIGKPLNRVQFNKAATRSVPKSNFGILVDSQSTQRLQLNNLKQKVRQLQSDIQTKEEELNKLKTKTGSEAQEEVKEELQKAYEVMRYLKRVSSYNGQDYHELASAI